MMTSQNLYLSLNPHLGLCFLHCQNQDRKKEIILRPIRVKKAHVNYDQDAKPQSRTFNILPDLQESFSLHLENKYRRQQFVTLVNQRSTLQPSPKHDKDEKQ